MSHRFVLVVDPNPLTHRRVVEALSDAGLEIISARDAPEAEQKARGRKIALLLAATVLPRGNGYDLARSVRLHSPDLVVYLLSGGFEVYNPDRGREAGVSGHIPKPFSSGLLRDVVAGSLGLDKGRTVDAPPCEDATAEVQVEAADPGLSYAPPSSGERIATFLPRDYAQVPLVRVDPGVVFPAMERAILEVLPEVVEVVLRRALTSSSSFRDLVEVAVDEAVRAQLPAIARRVVAERLTELEASDHDDP